MFRYLKKLKKFNKFKFLLPPKKSILILDTPGSDEIASLIENKDFEILDLRNELNLPVLILSIFSFKRKTITQKYIESYIGIVNPKILVTFIDNNISFFEIKLKDANFKKIIVQNGTGIINSLDSIDPNKKYDVDYAFVFSKNYSDFYKKIIKGKIVVHGSLRNNFISIRENKNPKNDILFISQFRDKNIFNHTKYSWDKWHKAEIETIKLLNKFCFEKNKKLTIAGFYQKEMKSEKHFYEEIFSKETNVCQYNFLPRENKNQTYKLMDDSKLIVTIDSAIGYEALVRENKLLFFHLRSYFLENPTLKFGWPKSYAKEGEFWVDYFNTDIINEKINFMLNLSKNDWKKIKNRYIPELMYYDQNNLKLKKLLSNYQNV
tara:strand:+ start:2521 stop:3651 length:1131 start_codon:yes stop_codon:yes gene_type:complete